MPMQKGYSQETIIKNIRRERKRGYPQNQAIAMAMSQAREARRAARKKGKATGK